MIIISTNNIQRTATTTTKTVVVTSMVEVVKIMQIMVTSMVKVVKIMQIQESRNTIKRGTLSENLNKMDMKTSMRDAPPFKTGNSAVHSLSCVTNRSYNTQGILIDTGASCHILSNKNYFQNFDENFVPSENYLELADGSK